MKTKILSEYFVLTALCLASGYVVYHYEKPLKAYATTRESEAAEIVVKARELPGFSAQDRQLIRNYVLANADIKGRALPAGLRRKTSRGSLPADWESKLVKGENLSAEVYGQCHELPPELAKKLSSPPLGTLRTSINGKVLLIAIADLKILDVIDVN